MQEFCLHEAFFLDGIENTGEKEKWSQKDPGYYCLQDL